MNLRPKVIIICGPTASGKSDLAVKIAQKYNGEIVSADSRQVYKNLNIGTGKVTKKEMSGIRHHLLDVENPKNRFTAENFRKLGEQIIEKIVDKDKTPIICGGTGFYIEALIKRENFPSVPPDERLRKELDKKNVNELLNILETLDKKRFENIDKKNKRRVIRAIEIAKTLGKVPETNLDDSKYETLWIGTTWSNEILKEKIHTRLLKRLKTGMLNEAKKLHTKGLSWKRMEELGLEYRYMAKHLQDKISKEEMIVELEKEIWHYAKRQMTWFKRNKNINWFNPTEIKKIDVLVKKFLE
jgi:tRNA dimethylallyltransferase